MGIFDKVSDVASSIFGGDKGAQDSTTTSTPWGPLQPYLLDAYTQAQKVAAALGPNWNA